MGGLRLRCLAWGSAAALVASGCVAVDAGALSVTVPGAGDVEATVPSVIVPTVTVPSVTVPSLPPPPSVTLPTPAPAPDEPVPSVPFVPALPGAPSAESPEPAPPAPSTSTAVEPTADRDGGSSTAAPLDRDGAVQPSGGGERRAGGPSQATSSRRDVQRGMATTSAFVGADAMAGTAGDAAAPGLRPRFGIGGVVVRGGGNDDAGGRSGLGLPPPIGDGDGATMLILLGLLVAVTLLVRRELLRQR
jgi:hypothetical protein